jgi:hypothetical protein
MDENTKNINKDDILKQTSTLIDLVEKAYKTGTAAHKVEQDIFAELLKMGHMLLAYLFDLYQGGEQGEIIELSNGRKVKRLPMKHKRSYLSIFGEFSLSRWVYGTREGRKIDCIPMDKRLQLPRSKYSYLLQDWGQSLVVSVPYAEASKVIQRIFSISFPVSGLERTVLSTSTSSHPYFDQQMSIKRAEPGQIVVISADCKGVVIRKPSAEEANSTQETKPVNIEQATAKGHFGNKKMAVVGASYSVDPYSRTPEKVLESLFRPKGVSVVKDDEQPRPKPVNKHIRACMDRDEKDTLQPARETIFSWLGGEIKQRNPTGNNTVVLIMDGEKKLWEMGAEIIAAAKNSVQILDVIHAASYLWKATEALSPNNTTKENIPIVKKYMGYLLNGQVKKAIRSFRYLATSRKITGKRLDQIKISCGYLENNAHRMRYNEYLAAGYPIGSGIIEGACRHIIVDRMEESGMRWVMGGAKAMLGLRCIYINGDWGQFIGFNIQQEQQRIHPATAKMLEVANDDAFRQLKVV